MFGVPSTGNTRRRGSATTVLSFAGDVLDGVSEAYGALFASKSEGGLRYRDYDMPDGYSYRLWTKDKSITILKSPRGGAGTVVTEDVQPEAYRAILAQIKAVRAGNVKEAIRVGAGITADLISPKGGKKKRKGRKRTGRSAAPVDVPMPEESTALPSWAPWAAGGIALAAVAFAMSGGGGKK